MPCLRCGSPLYNTVKGAECRKCGYVVPLGEDSVLRKCTECGKEAINEVDLEKFMKRKEAPHGRVNLCKDCRNARTRIKKKERFS